MKFRIWLTFVVCIILMCTLTKADDEEEEDDEERPKSCQKYIFDWVWHILQSVLKCLGGRSTFKMNNIFELVTRASCLLKCTLQEEGIVDLESGYFDDIGSAFYFEEMFDQPVRDIALPESQQCFSLAEAFNPKEYWCKSYLPFIECSFRAILKGLIPYGGDCVVNPTLGILFSVIKYLAPDSPAIAEDMEELRRAVNANRNPVKCFDKNCTRMYEYKKINGSQSIVLYDKDMNIVNVESRKNHPKPKDVSKDNSKYQTNSFTDYNPTYKTTYYNKYNNYSIISNRNNYPKFKSTN